MSHETGKIEILGMLNDKEMLFKYHQAKDPKNSSRIFTVELAVSYTHLESVWMETVKLRRCSCCAVRTNRPILSPKGRRIIFECQTNSGC